MIETELEALNFHDAPKMVSPEFPGTKAAAALTQSARTESMVRGGGRMPVVMDRAFGVTFKDPDGNTFIDLSAGVGVSSVGRCHPKVVAAIREQSESLMHAMEVNHLLNTPYTAADDVAAVIVEPVPGEGGYVPPSPEFLQLLRKACDRSGALLIVDEVQAGAGRTGKMWSVEHSGVKPDMLTFGKGVGGDVPMAGLVMRSDLAAKIPDGSAPNTFAANSVSAAVALTNIGILEDPALDLLNRAHTLGLEAQERIRDFGSPFVGEVRGRGLMIGIELVEDKATKEPLQGERLGKLMGYLTSHGVLMIPCGRYTNVMRVMPSLTIPRKLMFKALDIFGEGLSRL
ncbi:aminotransferase class III-fold pyridoxal phosphate-dependent enzyme [Piscinibacter sp.]|uniref:aminotransferase class III-fold pyridoxal phosphate-dependent enzyme n=1 Tax=Piscinibacter sp. TaxID=1903157 RepID=UPI002C065A99|nr:aminotransferase class III-fold pyridoxal phosphate-dependent enzyme [Albitalea sp.]HUG21083.1 aminotransferase class III-fold pyridoxal phosphate-dependent enzyme [Albitalea sp.]